MAVRAATAVGVDVRGYGVRDLDVFLAVSFVEELHELVHYFVLKRDFAGSHYDREVYAEIPEIIEADERLELRDSALDAGHHLVCDLDGHVLDVL